LQDFKSIRTSASARNILDTVSVAASESRILIPVTNNYFKLLRSRTFVRLAGVKAASIDAATNPSSVGWICNKYAQISATRKEKQPFLRNLPAMCHHLPGTIPWTFPERNLEPSWEPCPKPFPILTL